MIPEAAETLRLIFDAKSEGVPTNTILEKLNSEWPWKRPRGFGLSYLVKILHNRSLLGEFQPHILVNGKRKPDGDPISDYFPKIIKPEIFHAVQKTMAANSRSGGPTGKFCNVFRHLVRCAYCGSSMRYVDKGKSWIYFVCNFATNKKGCERHSIRYDEVEKLLLENCTQLKPEQVLPHPDEQSKKCERLQVEIEGIGAEISDTDEKIGNLVNQIETTANAKMRDRYEIRVQKLDEEKDSLGSRLDSKRLELASAAKGQKEFSKWQRDLGTMIKKIKDNPELRRKLNSHLKQFIKQILIYPVGDPKSEAHAGYLDAVADEANFPISDRKNLYRFILGIEKRANSREGRFIRVVFKTKTSKGQHHQVDLVPDGSLAFGMRLSEPNEPNERKGAWQFVSLDIDRLWANYRNGVKSCTT